MRFSRPLCRGGFESTNKYHGDPIVKLNEHRRNVMLKRDDVFRAHTGKAVWMRTTKRQIQDQREEEGLTPLMETFGNRGRLPPIWDRDDRAPPLDFHGLDNWVCESLCRALLRQGITKLTDIQERLLKALTENHDICAAAYTGSGKTFGLALVIAEGLLSRSDYLPFSFVALMPSQAVALQLQKWVALFCATNFTYVLDPAVPISVQLDDLVAREPPVLISTPEALTTLLDKEKTFRKKSNSRAYFRTYDANKHLRAVRGKDAVINQWKRVRQENTVLQLIRTNSQMVVVDEADAVLPTDMRNPRYELTRNLFHRILRLDGLASGGTASRQQQMIFISATLSHDSLTATVPFVQTSQVRTHTMNSALSFYKIQPSGPGSMQDGRDGLKMNEPMLVRPFDNKNSMTASAMALHDMSAAFPPTLHHAFLITNDTNEMISSVRLVLAAYCRSGYQITCLRAYPTPPKTPIQAPRFLVVCDPSQVALMVSCVQEGMGYPCAPFAGSQKELTESRHQLETGEIAALVVPNDSVRGLDFPGITHVFIVGVPETAQMYAHLAGRTARNGAHGMCITLLPRTEYSSLRRCLHDTLDKLHPVAYSEIAAKLDDAGPRGTQAAF